MIKTLDKKGFDFLAQHEGLVLHPYQDSVGIWTIGYGSTYYADGTHVAKGDLSITQEQAQDLFNNTSVQYAQCVSLSTKTELTQNQFNALFSLCYNIGTNRFKGSTVLKVINGDSDIPLQSAWLMWDKANHVYNDGLHQRRFDEYILFTS